MGEHGVLGVGAIFCDYTRLKSTLSARSWAMQTRIASSEARSIGGRTPPTGKPRSAKTPLTAVSQPALPITSLAALSCFCSFCAASQFARLERLVDADDDLGKMIAIAGDAAIQPQRQPGQNQIVRSDSGVEAPHLKMIDRAHRQQVAAAVLQTRRNSRDSRASRVTSAADKLLLANFGRL